jgi:hypothetical protein
MSDSEPKERAVNTKPDPSRREFGRAVLGAALGGAAFPAPASFGSESEAWVWRRSFPRLRAPGSGRMWRG